MSSLTDSGKAGEFDGFVYSQSPGYNEPNMRAAFKNAVPLRTIVICCYDPRAVQIPFELAKILPDEIYPGELVCDKNGNKVGSTATIFPIVVAGGRAVDALRSITIGQHLFGVQNIVVAHHTFCGTSSFTAHGLIEAYQDEQGADLRRCTKGTASQSPTSDRHSSTTSIFFAHLRECRRRSTSMAICSTSTRTSSRWS
jgi:carbonic anhydrase